MDRLERLIMRAPWILRLSLAFAERLPRWLRRRFLSAILPRMFRVGSDPQALGLIRDLIEPDFELHAIGFATALGIHERYRGPEGLDEFVAEWTKQMDWPTMRAESVIDIGDRLLIEVSFTNRGRASGAQTSRRMGYVMWLSRRGRVARLDAYWDWEEARAAS
jgi:hypothetical protein